MPMIHRRALITGLLASVAAPALARLTQGATTVYYTPYAVGSISFDAILTSAFNRGVRKTVDSMIDNLYQPYGEPSFPITTPRQIRP